MVGTFFPGLSRRPSKKSALGGGQGLQTAQSRRVMAFPGHDDAIFPDFPGCVIRRERVFPDHPGDEPCLRQDRPSGSAQHVPRVCVGDLPGHIPRQTHVKREWPVAQKWQTQPRSRCSDAAGAKKPRLAPSRRTTDGGRAFDQPDHWDLLLGKQIKRLARIQKRHTLRSAIHDSPTQPTVRGHRGSTGCHRSPAANLLAAHQATPCHLGRQDQQSQHQHGTKAGRQRGSSDPALVRPR